MYRYNEAHQLEKLLKTFSRLMNADIANNTISTVTIHIGNRRVELLAGAPQFEGVCKMVEHIASENFYEVDFENLTVKDCSPSVEEICLKALQYSLEQAQTSKINVLDMSSAEITEYWLKEAINALRKTETEE